VLAAQPATTASYTFRPGDVIDITVEGYSEYSRQLSIRQDGFISYPLIGEVKVEGQTASQVEAAIGEGLAGRLDSPRVFVSLHRGAPKSIYVWGEVKQANRYLFETEQIYLMQALTMAGGPNYSRAKLTEIQVWRDGEIYQTVDLTRLVESGNQRDVPLAPDDVIYVPSRLQQRPIMVTGAALEPGMYEIESPQVHPLQALMMAGGALQDVADLTAAQIIRSTGERISVNLGGLEVNPVMLNSGDALHIPNAYEEQKVSIIGAVARPGQYAIKQPIHVIEALGLAGGWDEEKANLKKAQIIRMDGKQEEVDLLELLEAGELQAGPVLYPGDHMRIPNRLRINWYALLTVTSTATLIYNIVR
jgi:polysaccharide export outer membrane protein